MNGSSDQEFHVSPSGASLPRLVEMVRLTRRRPIELSVRKRHVWGLDYHTENAGEYSLDGETWSRREKQTAHLYAPGRRFRERCSEDDVPFPETYFIFQAPQGTNLDALVSYGNGFAHFVDTSRRLLDILGGYLSTVWSGHDMYWRAQGLLLLLLDGLASARHVEGSKYEILSEDVETAETLATRVDRYLMAHYHQATFLDDIARSVGVSRSTLTHRYREETGTTPMARLRIFRLDTARSLILKGDRLKSVSLRTGFYDEYHLSKAFKERFGQSPRAFLQGMQH